MISLRHLHAAFVPSSERGTIHKTPRVRKGFPEATAGRRPIAPRARATIHRYLPWSKVQNHEDTSGSPAVDLGSRFGRSRRPPAPGPEPSSCRCRRPDHAGDNSRQAPHADHSPTVLTCADPAAITPHATTPGNLVHDRPGFPERSRHTLKMPHIRRPRPLPGTFKHFSRELREHP